MAVIIPYDEKERLIKDVIETLPEAKGLLVVVEMNSGENRVFTSSTHDAYARAGRLLALAHLCMFGKDCSVEGMG